MILKLDDFETHHRFQISHDSNCDCYPHLLVAYATLVGTAVSATLREPNYLVTSICELRGSVV